MEIVEDDGRCAARRPLIPREDVLYKPDIDNTHAPLEILGPRRHDGRERYSAEANHGLSLKVPKQREGVSCDVRRRIGIAQSRYNSGCDQRQASYSCCGPFDTDKVN